jgi:DHA2 family multidrug resistance protein-like MFS transporter
MLDLSLFRNRKFTAALGIMVVGALTMGGVFLLTSQYLQLVAGLSAAQAGIALVPQAGAVVAGSLIAPRLARRYRPEFVLGFGMLIAAAGILLFTMLDGGSSVVLVVLGLSVAAFGMGPQGVLCTEMVIGSVPARKAGAASAMSETSAEFGIAMGIAVFGSIGTAVYRADVTVPDGAPAEVGDSMAGALNAVTSMDDQLAATVLTSAREAFTGGLHTVAAIAAGIVVAFALIGMAALRKSRSAEVTEIAEEEKDLATV